MGCPCGCMENLHANGEVVTAACVGSTRVFGSAATRHVASRLTVPCSLSCDLRCLLILKEGKAVRMVLLHGSGKTRG